MSVVATGCVTAQAIAEAMNGAVHGVARTVVITPLRNAPSGPSFVAADWTDAAAEETGDRNFPNAEQAECHRKHDGCDRDVERCAAELAAPGEAERGGQEKPSNTNTATMPAANQRFSTSALRGFCPIARRSSSL